MLAATNYRPVTMHQRISSAGLALLLIVLLALLQLLRVAAPPSRMILPELHSFEVAPPPPPVAPPPPLVRNGLSGGSRSVKAPARAVPAAPGPAPRPLPAPAPLLAPPALAAPDRSQLLDAPPSLAPATSGGGASLFAEGGGAGGVGLGTGSGRGRGDGSGEGYDPSAAISANWVRMATWEEVHDFHPTRALSAKQSGRVQLRCQVTLARKLVNCLVAEEAPADWGFGTAALRLSRTLRVFPREVNNVPIDRGWVKFVVKFDVTPPRAPVSGAAGTP